MRRCSKCGVSFSGSLDKCPLCQSELSGKATPSVFPHNETKRTGSIALSILTFTTGVCMLGMIFVWQVFEVPGDIVLSVCLALIMNQLFMRSFLTHHPDFLRVVIRYFLILFAIAVVWFLVTHNLAVTTFVIPGICLVALVFDAVLVIIFRDTFVSGYAKYLLFNVFFGLTPLLLVIFNLTTWNILAYVSALTASILMLGLLVFLHKQLLAEIRKLFSM